tara:strand:+ start:47295 stop:48005 length:711 start_codon:yes stop_codon:yes gene_type:complete
MSERTETMTQASAPRFAHDGSYVDWASILAGAAVATGIAFVFTTFGAAIGLSLISPYTGEGSAMAALIATASWLLWTTISSFMAGGYIAGRMRRRMDNASADEVSVRDGIHGLTTWGVAILLGAFLVSATADSALQATAKSADAVATVAQNVKVPTADAAAGDGNAAVSKTATGAAAQAAEVSEAEAEAARKYSVISAFVVAASLMIAAAGAYWAANVGGQHRDEGRAFARFGRWT